MELSKDSRPPSALFTSARDVRIVADDGSMCAVFEEGQTRRIPKALFNAALTAGLMPKEPLDLKDPPLPENKPQEVSTREGLVEACKTMISRGNPADFTMTGHPRAASAKKLVDFDFTARDLREAFEQAMHEVTQDGDDSTEHPEQSSSAA